MNTGARNAVQSRAVPSEEQEAAIEAPVNDATIPEKVETPVQASVTEVVPTTPVEETPVAVPEQTRGVPVESAKPQVIKLKDKSTLVELPGMQAKSADQIAFELNKARDITRAEGNLNHREEQLRQRELEFERKQKETVEVKPVIVEPKRERPAPPKDAVPGDPEYDEYLLSLGAHLGAEEAEKRLKPQLDKLVGDIETRSKRESAEAEKRQTYESNLAANRSLYNETLSVLPFAFDSLSDVAQTAVMERIDQEAQLAGLDLKQGGHLRPFLPTELRAIMRAAYPANSLPPGYEEAKEEPITTPAIEAVKELENKPLVAKDKPVPLHQTGSPGISARKDKPREASGSWTQRLDAKAKELQQ